MQVVRVDGLHRFVSSLPMLRADADALAQRLLAALPPTRPYTRADLAGPELPRPIGHFLLQSLDRRLDLEATAQRAARSGWFRYDAPDVAAAEASFWLAVGRYAQIPADEWPRALEQTVHQVVPYLVAPAHALVHFVYSDGRATLPLDVIERRMRYFLPYPYLRDVVGAYAQQKGLAEIERDDFSRLLTRIEARTGTAYDAESLVALAADLFDTLGEGPERRIAREHALRFLADKGLPHAVARLREAPERVAVSDLRAALRATPGGLLPDDDDPPAPASRPAATPEASPSAAVGAVDLPAPSPPVSAPLPAATPEEPRAPAPVAPPPVAPPPAPVATPVADAAPAGPAAARWEQMAAPVASSPQHAQMDAPVASSPRHEQVASPAHEPTPLWKRLLRGDLVDDDTLELERRVLGPAAEAHRKRFVKDLFGGDGRAYGDALAVLAAQRSWAETAGVIARIFRDNAVDLYGDAAIAFTDLAEQRFA